MREIEFDIRLRGKWQDATLHPIGHQQCPGCGTLLMLHQPDEGSPHRLLANCSCEECGAWFAVIMRPDDRVAYIIRLPSVIELVEAISRQGLRAGPQAEDGA